MFTRILSALAAAGLTAITLAAATPLYAQSLDDQVQVRIADLDLSSDKGAAIFDRRVRAAARQICGCMPTTNLNLQRQVADCQAEVAANAKQELASSRAGGPSYRLAMRVR